MAETLGWGGGLLTVFGVVSVTWDFWSQISGWALVGLLALATSVLGVAAAVVGQLTAADDRDTLAENLSTALWWMSGIAGTVTTYVAFSELSDGRTFLALLAASVASTAMLGAYSLRSGRDHALAGTILSAALAAFSAASLASTSDPVRGAVVVAAGLIAAAGLAVARPTGSRLSWGTVMVLLFGSSQAVVLDDRAGSALIVAVMIAMIIVAVTGLVARSTGQGITAALLAALVVCEVLYDVAPQVFSLSTSILLIGITMTGGCIWLVRRASKQA